VVKVLPDIRKAVDPDVANRLDVTLKYFAVEGTSLTRGYAAAGGSAAG
jgi:hypothetical protein